MIQNRPIFQNIFNRITKRYMIFLSTVTFSKTDQRLFHSSFYESSEKSHIVKKQPFELKMFFFLTGNLNQSHMRGRS